jgi:hypothetical protein
VHVAVTTVKESWLVRDTRKFPELACTSAALPTVASGELPSTETVTTPLPELPLRTGMVGSELPLDEEVGLAQPSINEPMAMNETA